MGGNPYEVVAPYERAVETHERMRAPVRIGDRKRSPRKRRGALDLYRQASECFRRTSACCSTWGSCTRTPRSTTGHNPAISGFWTSIRTTPGQLYLKDRRLAGHVLRRGGAEAHTIGCRRFSAFRCPTSSCRSAAAIAAEDGHADPRRLTRTTEQELLSSKNFGETSLVEIRDMLASKGLESGSLPTSESSLTPIIRFDRKCRPTSRPCSNDRSPI